MYEPGRLVRQARGRRPRRAPKADALCYGTFQLRFALDLLERKAQPVKTGEREAEPVGAGRREDDRSMADAAPA